MKPHFRTDRLIAAAVGLSVASVSGMASVEAAAQPSVRVTDSYGDNEDLLLFEDEYGVSIGSSSLPELFVIANNGNTQLTLDDIVMRGNKRDFAIRFLDANGSEVVAETILMNPGSSMMVEVQFVPTQAGVRNARLEIDTDDPSAPEVRLLMSGRGLDSVPQAPLSGDAIAPSESEIPSIYVTDNTGDDDNLNIGRRLFSGPAGSQMGPGIFEFHNPGTQPVTLQWGSVSGDTTPFTWTRLDGSVLANGDTIEVAPGVAEAVVVTFESNTLGLYAMEQIVNLTGGAPLTLTVTGEATDDAGPSGPGSPNDPPASPNDDNIPNSPTNDPYEPQGPQGPDRPVEDNSQLIPNHLLDNGDLPTGDSPTGDLPSDERPGDLPTEEPIGDGTEVPDEETEPPVDNLDPASRLLTVGPGFSGATPTPPMVASTTSYAYGETARAIAQFNVVPGQIVDEAFEIGVVAFHVWGIDRVSFSVDGGPWLDIHEPTLNPRTGTVEYYAVLDGSSLSNGDVEVRAIAYPIVGEPLVIDTRGVKEADEEGGNIEALMLAVPHQQPTVRVGAGGVNSIQDAIRDLMNDHGTLDNAVIELTAGSYVFGAGNSDPETLDGHWLTIRPAPGVTREDVVFYAGESNRGFDDANIRLEDVSVQPTQINNKGALAPVLQGGGEGWLWLDNVAWSGIPGTLGDAVKKNNFDRYYVTDSTFRDIERPFVQCRLVRNSDAKYVMEDGLRSVDLCVNVDIESILTLENDGGHPDVWQYVDKADGYDNVIVYGLTAMPVMSEPGNAIHSQGLNLSTGRNSAFVGVEIDNRRNRIASRQGTGHHNLGAGGNFSNVIIADSVFYGETNRLSTSSFASGDWFVFRDVSMPDEGDPYKFIDRDNVYYQPLPPMYD